MKNYSLITVIFLFILSLNLTAFGQNNQSTQFNRYRLRRSKPNQDKVYMKIEEVKTVLEKGWVVKKEVAGISYEKKLLEPLTVIEKKYKAVTVVSNWKIGEIKHTDDEPGRLYINPYYFTEETDSIYNNTGYLIIPENGFITLRRSFVKWQAITIPFAVRPGLNDSIGSQITSDLKIGASFSYNINWERFKNRRLKAEKTVKGISAGIAFGFSQVTLDASSTSLSDNPYSVSEDGLAFFIHPGLGVNLKGFQLLFSYGWDLPITENIEDWNYSKQGYFGLGLGIGLDIFGKL